MPTAGGKPQRLTSTKGNETEPTWSPDGRLIAFVAKRGDDKQPQLYVIAANGGEATRVSDVPTGVASPKWFPDSKRIAFITEVWPDITDWAKTKEKLTAREESKMSAMTWDRPPVTHWDHFIEDRIPHLYSIAIEGGDARRDHAELRPVAPAARKRQGFLRHLAGRPGNRLRREHRHDRHATRTPTSTSCRQPAARRRTSPRTIPRATRSRRTARTAATSPTRSRPSRASTATPSSSGSSTASRDARRRVAADWDRSVSGIAWAPDSKSFYAPVDDAATERIYRFDVAKGTQHALTTSSSFSSLAIAGKPATLVALRQSFTEPPTLVAVSTKDGAATKLSDHNDEQLAATSFGKVESVTYKGAEGADIQMWVIYPPGFDPAKKYPLYLILHGGPHNGVYDSWTFRWNAAGVRELGLRDGLAQLPRLERLRPEIRRLDQPRRHHAMPYEDTIKAAEWFDVEALDRQRTAWPRAAAATAASWPRRCSAAPHPFKTLIAHAAVYDNYAMYGGDYGAEKARFFEAWEKPEEFGEVLAGDRAPRTSRRRRS